MPETIELPDVVLRVIGAFYTFAGYVATRSAMMSRFLDQAIGAIAAQKPKPLETAQNAWLLATSALVLIGGVLLLAGIELAAWVFALSTLGQGAYIYYVAPRFFDADDPVDASGRRQTANAFVRHLCGSDCVRLVGGSSMCRMPRRRRSSPLSALCCSTRVTWGARCGGHREKRAADSVDLPSPRAMTLGNRRTRANASR